MSHQSKQKFESELMHTANTMLDDLKDECPDDMTIDEWNEVYIEVQREIHEVIAK